MRVAIVGGGSSGLMTAYLLNRQSVAADITLFEASPRLGGKLVTALFQKAAVTYEAGTAELYDYSMNGPDPLRELVEEFGLPTKPLDGRTVVLDGNFLRSDDDIRRHLGQKSLDALQDFRQLARNTVSAADYYESDWQEHNRNPLSEQTFHDLLATIQDEGARKYIEVSVHSDLATEPHQTNAIYGLHNFLMNEPSYMSLYTLKGGLEQLTKKLAEQIAARVLLNHRVTGVEKTRQQTYRVRYRAGGQDLSDTFDGIVVALPNNWIPAIEWRGEKLAKVMHAHHAQYDYPAHYLRVSVLFNQPFWREQIDEGYFMLDAFGGCCVYDETGRAANRNFGVLGWLLAGEAALNFNNFDDATIVEQVLESLPPSFGFRREMFIEGRVHRWLGSVNGLPAGRPQIDPDARHVPDPEGHPGLFVVGDYLFDSTLNGVMDSASIAVEFVLEHMAEMAGERVAR